MKLLSELKVSRPWLKNSRRRDLRENAALGGIRVDIIEMPEAGLVFEIAECRDAMAFEALRCLAGRGENGAKRRNTDSDRIASGETTRRCSFVRELHRATAICFHSSKIIRSEQSVSGQNHLTACILDFINNSRTRNDEEENRSKIVAIHPSPNVFVHSQQREIAGLPFDESNPAMPDRKLAPNPGKQGCMRRISGLREPY